MLKTFRANAASQKYIEKARTAFDKFDTDKGGTIEEAELHAIMTSMGQNVTQEMVAELMREIDTDGDGTVNF
jgi:calmodulin